MRRRSVFEVLGWGLSYLERPGYWHSAQRQNAFSPHELEAGAGTPQRWQSDNCEIQLECKNAG